MTCYYGRVISVGTAAVGSLKMCARTVGVAQGMNMKCSNCIYWQHHGNGAVWGDCLRNSDLFNGNHCLVDFDVKNTGGVGYTVEMETHPDFGCVLYEERGK